MQQGGDRVGHQRLPRLQQLVQSAQKTVRQHPARLSALALDSSPVAGTRWRGGAPDAPGGTPQPSMTALMVSPSESTSTESTRSLASAFSRAISVSSRSLAAPEV